MLRKRSTADQLPVNEPSFVIGVPDPALSSAQLPTLQGLGRRVGRIAP